MSTLLFSARFTPNNSSPISATDFDVEASLFDGTGQFGGADVQIGDVVYLDTFASMTAPNTVSRYKVIYINSASGMNVNARLRYDDSGDVVDPSEIIGTQGFIARASANFKLTHHAAPTIHSFPDYVVQLSRNQESRAILDENLGGTGGGTAAGSLVKQMQNGHTAEIPAGKPVAKLANGKIVPADSDASTGQAYVGITKETIAVDGLGDVYLPGNNIPNAVLGLGFTSGQDVFLSETAGTYTNNPGGFTGSNDSVIKVGIADCAAGIATTMATDLIMFTEVILRP